MESLDFGVSFGKPNFNPDDIQVDDVMLVTFVIDRSGSISNYVNDMNDAMSETLKEWKGSHHSDKIMYSRVDFDSSVEVVHGFTPIASVDHIDVSPRGMTALYDGVYTALENSRSYYESIVSSGADCKVMIFVFTDGDDNSSSKNPSDVKKKLDEIYSNEENFGNFDLVLFGLNDPSYFKGAAQQMGITKVAVDDPSDPTPIGKKIRGMITVASQSVSSGSTANIANVTF